MGQCGEVAPFVTAISPKSTWKHPSPYFKGFGFHSMRQGLNFNPFEKL
jgi:hypothetical protein